MDESPLSRRFEPRWPAAVAIIAFVALLALLSGRLRVLPSWLPYVMVAVALVPMLAVELTRGGALWLRIERVTTMIFVVVAGLATLAGLSNILHSIVGSSSQMSGEELLTSSIAAWITNVIVFSLLYWWLDRGSPEARIRDEGVMPDWVFPQEGAVPGSVPASWRPTYIDYLFLSFSTGTAFSTTDTVPVTSRAKMFMMLESAISLVTITAVASRAINILGS